jgi:ornithine decarboxylase
VISPELHRGLRAEPSAPARPTPYLALDASTAVSRYRALADAFGLEAVHYAVKVNPHPALIVALTSAGARFDVASAGEVDQCLAAGAPLVRIETSGAGSDWPLSGKFGCSTAEAYALLVLAQDVPVLLPLTLAEGDEVRFSSAGAYTSSYSTVGFNGFGPLRTELG